MLRAITILALAAAMPLAALAEPSIDADGTVTIHPGETVAVAFAGADDPSHPVLATDASAPATMVFTLKAEPGLGMVLNIQSRLSVMVKYDAVLAIGSRGGHTSSCPVMAGKIAMENWPDPITELKLSGFRKVDGTGMVCN